FQLVAESLEQDLQQHSMPSTPTKQACSQYCSLELVSHPAEWNRTLLHLHLACWFK
ncbi:hypothetical protein DAT39_011811, partial [Clarias magur]